MHPHPGTRCAAIVLGPAEHSGLPSGGGQSSIRTSVPTGTARAT